jgi:tetratricopeptide (TPR) repeat protein
LWRYQLDDRSLKSVEKNILHYQRTSDEVPGWMAPEIYREYLKTGNMSAILGVFYHNSMDVVSLCALMYAYVNVMIDKLDMHLDYQTINYALARLHEKHDNLQQSIQYYQDALAQTNLPNSIRINALNELSAIYKKSGDFEKAVVLWEMASEFNDVRSVIELAKYYEHRMREYESALYWVEKGIEVSKESNSYLMIELTHRKERILKKWSSNE